MVEKPCRNDLESPSELSQHLATLCTEEQLYQTSCTCVSRECWTSPSCQQETGKHHLLYLLEWAPHCLGPQGLLERKGSKHLSSGLLLFFLIPALELQRHCKDELCVFFLMIKLPSSQLKVLSQVLGFFLYWLPISSSQLLGSYCQANGHAQPFHVCSMCTSGKAGKMVCDNKVKLSPRPPCVLCSCYLQQSMSNLVQYFLSFLGNRFPFVWI